MEPIWIGRNAHMLPLQDFPRPQFRLVEALVYPISSRMKFSMFDLQAALAPVALDMARKLQSEGNYENANIVLIIGVIAIVLTAPIGAVLMVKLAPKWLKGPQSLNLPANADVNVLPMHWMAVRFFRNYLWNLQNAYKHKRILTIVFIEYQYLWIQYYIVV